MPAPAELRGHALSSEDLGHCYEFTQVGSPLLARLGYPTCKGKHAGQMQWGQWCVESHSHPGAASTWRVYYNREMERKIGKRETRKKEKGEKVEVYLLRKAMKLKMGLPWRNQNVRVARVLGYLQRRAANREWKQFK